MGYTILGDTDFMDNVGVREEHVALTRQWLPTNKYMFKFSRTMVLYHSYSDPTKKHQMVSTRDIGRAGAKAIAEPEKYLNKKLRLAGDEQTPADIERIYKEVGCRRSGDPDTTSGHGQADRDDVRLRCAPHEEDDPNATADGRCKSPLPTPLTRSTLTTTTTRSRSRRRARSSQTLRACASSSSGTRPSRPPRPSKQ